MDADVALVVTSSRRLTRGVGLAALALLLLASGGCSREVRADLDALPESITTRLSAADPAPDPAPAATSSWAPAPADDRLTLTSVLYSENDSDVGARSAGVVQRYLVDLGDRVEAGQLLAVLQDEREIAAVSAARAAQELAELEHERARRLMEENVITRAEMDQAVYRLRATQAAAEEAAVRLEYTRIRAPFDGVVTRRYIRVGQGVEERAPLFRVTALRPLRALLRVPEVDAVRVAPGQAIRLRDLEGAEVIGAVARISPAIDPASGTVEVLVEIADPGRLRPGSAVSVDLSRGSPPAPHR
jgi:RND family efflux transporter MFP subunit